MPLPRHRNAHEATAATAFNGWILLARFFPSPSLEEPGDKMWLGVQIGVAVLNFTVLMVVGLYLKRTGGEEWKGSVLSFLFADVGGFLAIMAFMPVIFLVMNMALQDVGTKMLETFGTPTSTP
jgi:hypothetical protein